MDLDLFLPYIKHVFNPRKKLVMSVMRNVCPYIFPLKKAKLWLKKDGASAILDIYNE